MIRVHMNFLSRFLVNTLFNFDEFFERLIVACRLAELSPRLADLGYDLGVKSWVILPLILPIGTDFCYVIHLSENPTIHLRPRLRELTDLSSKEVQQLEHCPFRNKI